MGFSYFYFYKRKENEKMKGETVLKFIKSIPAKAVEHGPEILAGLGVGLGITSTVLAVKATPKAIRLIEQAKDKKKINEGNDATLTAGETVKAAWKPYIPAAITGVMSAACVIGGQSVSGRRNAALATAYQLSTTALTEYKEKVVETIGEKKERAIHDELAKDKVEKNPVNKSEVIFTGSGKTLCHDAITGRYFHSDKNAIERSVNELNRRMTSGMEMYISLNEFYDYIGVPRVTPMGDELGWRVDNGLIQIHYGAVLTGDDEPCMVIEHLIPPEYGYNKLY